MHIKEVFDAIYTNHIYEYLVIDRNFKIIEFSDKVGNYCSKEYFYDKKSDIFDVLPELFGMQIVLQELINGLSSPLLLSHVFKEPDFYINIRIHPGHLGETLIILFEDVTSVARLEQISIQERNEKSLLLDELADKNRQLQAYNEDMQRLVSIETQKNLEKQKMLELQSRQAQMGEMIGMITHQWKQPLGVIRLSCTFLEISQRRDRLDETTLLKQLKDIDAQVSYMNTTVSDFQNFFNPSKEKRFFNLHDTIQGIIDLVRNEYELNNIAIEISGDNSIEVNGYSNEYAQVILSILKNAKDAFIQKPHNMMMITISIDKKSENNCSIVTIKDNAGGIPEDVIDTVFDLYMSTKADGSGLGLNIAKNVIEVNMNGKLHVQNIDDGAEFSIIL